MRITSSIFPISFTPLLILVTGLLASFDAPAAERTWSGAAGPNWTDDGNWVGGSAPSNRDRLIFTNSLSTSTINDFSSGRRFTLSLDDGGFTLDGNQIRLNNEGTNDLFQISGVTNTISLDILLGGARDFTVQADGALVVDGTVSGNGRALRKRGEGVLELTSSNNSFGRLDIHGGTVGVAHFDALGTDDVTLGADGYDVVFEYTGGTATIANEFRLGSNDRSTAHTGAGEIRNTGTGTLTFSAANFNQTRSRARASRTLSFNGSADIVIAGRIRDNSSAGEVALAKHGANTLTLAGVNTYTGATTIWEGLLLVEGSLTGGDITVWSDASLGGGGQVAGSVVINAEGFLEPGNGVGAFASGSVELRAGSTLAMQLDSDAARSVGADLLVVDGDLNVHSGARLTLTDLGLSGVEEGTIYSLVNYSGTWNGGFFTVNGLEIRDGGTFFAAGQQWEMDYDEAQGGSNFSSEYLGGGSSHVTIEAIPEPAVMSLLLAFGGGLLMVKRLFC